MSNGDLSLLLADLWAWDIRSLLVEGGGATLSAFINQKQGDRLYLFMAPMIIGEGSGHSWTSTLNPLEKLSHSVALSRCEVSSLGKDLLLTARFL